MVSQVPRRRGHRVRAVIPIAAVAALALSTTVAAHAATTDPNPTPLEQQNAALSRSAATQGMVLLQNRDHALPMPKKGNVAVFGVGAYKTVKGGTGSGNVNNRYTITVRQGLESAGYKVTTSDAYWNAMTSAYDTKYPPSSGGSGFGGSVDYASVEQPLTSTSVQPTAKTTTALFVVARNSGEGSDRSSGAGDYQLTSTETDDIKLIGQTYQHVVVVLNTGGILDTSFVNQINSTAKDPSGSYAVDSLLLMSQAGEESGNAVVQVLNGKVDPSGKLTDTWASKYSYYPASATFGNNDGNSVTEQYSEGVYVGYRYFDSFYKSIDAANPAGVVNYPFGYGLSYTSFSLTPLSVNATAKTVTVKARVRNTGYDYSGRDVVQVYFSAPQTGEDKPYQQLAGYGKTDNLAPGASQTVTIKFNTTDMASYNDSTASYRLDAGSYVIRVGDSSRNTHVAAKLALATTVTTEQVAHEMNDATAANPLTSNPANFYSYPAEQAELAAAPVVTLAPSSFHTVNGVSKYEQNVPVDSSSPYYALDGTTISSTTAYLPKNQTNWEGTGAAYQAKTGETVKKVTSNPDATLYDVYKGRISLQNFVAGLSVDQLSNIVEGGQRGGTVPQAVGAAGYTTATLEILGIPGMVLSDGPAGLRLTQQIPATATTPAQYQYETAWPIGTLLAQTWDRALVQKVGHAVGKEMQAAGATVWLAPGMNIHRDPLNGRNFEYYSEDPLVAGLTAAADTLGVQSVPGVGVTIKHYVANNQEANRGSVDESIDERALREIYLRGFQITVESAQPMAVMSSYNKVNGTWSSADYDQETDLLRGEWGFKGLVMTDWGGSHNPVATMYAGNDLIMPGNNQAEIVNNLKQVNPTLDVNGLPVITTTINQAQNRTRYSLALGGLTLDPAGDQTITTTVDATSDLANPKSTTVTVDPLNNTTTTPHAPYTSVQDAYIDVQSLLAGTALNATQKAAITVTPTYQTPGDSTTPVVSYTLTMKGHYAIGGYTMRLGDVQRSAMRVLDTVMHSEPFAQLANIQNVSGIKVGPYSAQAGPLRTVMTATLGGTNN